MTRSLPEKTFEHWCSIHLNYRYRSHLQMWWPSSGADIEVARVPRTPGKRIWLELKTVEWNATARRHELFVDLRQLIAYGKETVPDYYVFPVPPWQGVLEDALSSLWLGTLPAALLAYQTRSKLKWFADWTFVVPGHVLRRLLAAKIAAFLATGQGGTLRVAGVTNGTFTWVQPTLRSAVPILWKSFWEIIEKCGSAHYPAQFILPGPPIGGTPIGGLPSGGPPSTGPSVPRSSLVAKLQVAKRELEAGTSEAPETTVYGLSKGDEYLVTPLDVISFADEFEWNTSRALILIEAGGLRI